MESNRINVSLDGEALKLLGSIAAEEQIQLTEALKQAIAISYYLKSLVREGSVLLYQTASGEVREIKLVQGKN